MVNMHAVNGAGVQCSRPIQCWSCCCWMWMASRACHTVTTAAVIRTVVAHDVESYDQLWPILYYVYYCNIWLKSSKLLLYLVFTYWWLILHCIMFYTLLHYPVIHLFVYMTHDHIVLWCNFLMHLILHLYENIMFIIVLVYVLVIVLISYLYCICMVFSIIVCII